MMKLLTALCMASQIATAQSITPRLISAMKIFTGDTQLTHASFSLYVINAKSGAIIYDNNGQLGLAPASTQKIITSVTAFETLGPGYQYKTTFTTAGNQLLIKPSGDPTLGSWRYAATNENRTLNQLAAALNITSSTQIVNEATAWNSESIPDGWMWQDIGNYYGAGAGAFNWRENQFDVILSSGSAINDFVAITATQPNVASLKLISKLTSAKAGSGDNAYIYLPNGNEPALIRGTIPVNEKAFKISGSITNPSQVFLEQLKQRGKQNPKSTSVTVTSPTLDSIIYWFNKKSINLYGEAILKTMAFQTSNIASTDKGVSYIKEFWSTKGIEPSELNIRDGSGLSPLNRVTTHAQVTVLQYAQSKPWYKYFYDAIPEYNEMKMKSGTISGAKGFCGYHHSKDGNDYIFSFLVNNYNGSANMLVQKMYTVLNVLK